jgi:hypothetical protein
MTGELEPPQPTWRQRRERYNNVAVQDLRLLFDELSQDDRLYFTAVARVVVETDEPVYPCRPSEYRRVSEVEVFRVKPKMVNAVVHRLKHVEEREAWRKYQDYLALKDLEPEAFYEGFSQLSAEERESVRRIWKRIWRRAGSSSGTGRHNWEHVPTALQPKSPCWDKSKCTYPTGRFTTWLRTDEIRHALGHGRLIQCHEVFLTMVNVEHQRLWQKLRNEALRRYGRICMRCGRTGGQMHIDHINPWSEFPDQRYDPGNLQVLCRDCHAWKTDTDTDTDFRPT